MSCCKDLPLGRHHPTCPVSVRVEEILAESSQHDPGSRPCRCRCGYTCGGPGTCELFRTDMSGCINSHWKEDCDHRWGTELVTIDEGCASVVCTVCGTSRMGHDVAVGP